MVFASAPTHLRPTAIGAERQAAHAAPTSTPEGLQPTPVPVLTVPRGKASAWGWTADLWAPTRVAKFKRDCWTACNVCAGSTLAVGSAYAVAQTIAPPLLRLVDTAAGVRGIFRQMYVVGPLLSALLGLGGVYGYIATALMLLTTVNTMVNSENRAQVRSNWTLAHIATGFAIAPLLTLPLPIASTLGAVALAGSLNLGLSWLLSRRLDNDHPSWQGCIMSICLGVALAPLGSMAAMGLPTEELFTNVAYLVVAGISTISILTFWFNYTKMASDSIAYLNEFKKHAPDGLRLDLPLPNRLAPNVFGTTQEITDSVIACLAYTKDRRPIGKEKLLLRGSTEAARSSVAYAISAELGGVPIYAFQLKNLLTTKSTSSVSSSVNVQLIFDAATQVSRDSHTPVILYFEDADMMFAVENIEAAFLTCLDGVNRDPRDNLIIIASTDKPENISERILGRFTKRATLTTPALQEFHTLFVNTWRDTIAASPLQHDTWPDIPEEELAQLCKKAADFGDLDAASIRTIIDGAIKKGVAYRFIEKKKNSAGASLAPKDIVPVMYAALHEELKAACTVSLPPADADRTSFTKPTVPTTEQQASAWGLGGANLLPSYAE